LVSDCGMTEELATKVVDACSDRAKVVAEEMQNERTAAELKQAEEGAVVDALLGGGSDMPVSTDQRSEAAADNILGFGSSEPTKS